MNQALPGNEQERNRQVFAELEVVALDRPMLLKAKE